MPDILDQLRAAVSNDVVITDRDMMGLNPLATPPLAMLKPRTTEEVSAILRICNEAGQAVVPQGGMTGLVQGGQTTSEELALSLSRMNRIEEIDAESRTMTVQSGVPLQTVQEEAAQAGMLFPLDLGARGSATIGGNVSTNAGGNRVIRYGMTREQVLGMEVVLADGTVVSSMNKVIKNNTGYDIKHLFIGAEGTLGIVTRLVLRLRPLPASQEMAMVGADSFKSVVAFLNHIDNALGGTLSAFEVMWKEFYDLVTTPPAEGKPPLDAEYPYYILVEAMGGNPEADQERFLSALNASLETGLIQDAVIAKSQGDRNALWALRDDVGQLGRNWPVFTFDISVSLNKMESYVTELQGKLSSQWETNTCVIFGHLGDGNLHVNIGVGDGSPETRTQVEEAVYSGLGPRGGSISAEHGIGLQKKEYLSWSRNEDELALMGQIKQALDPKGILNPGKVLG